jgi:hypothetical protein
MKIHSLKEAGKNTDDNDTVVGMYNVVGNMNQLKMVQTLVMNYDLLPIALKEQLENCDNDLNYLMKKCENFHGEGNCTTWNKFTVVQKCPEGYLKDDLTRCVKDCSKLKLDKKTRTIDHNCHTHTTYFLNQFKKYSSLEKCLEENENCLPSTEDPNIFTQDCLLNFKRVAFICIPLCFNEMDIETIEKIKQDEEKYCFKDYVTLGMPFYDL